MGTEDTFNNFRMLLIDFMGNVLVVHLYLSPLMEKTDT